MLVYLIGDAAHQQVPVLRHSLIFVLLIIIIFIVLLVIFFVDGFSGERIEVADFGDEVALPVAHCLSEQEGCLRVLQSQYRLHEMGDIDLVLARGDSQGASRAKHGLEERGRLRQVLDGAGHPVLLGQPAHQFLMHLQTVHSLCSQCLAEGVLAQECQEHVLGHDELVVEEACLLHGVVHQAVHVVCKSHTITHNSFSLLKFYSGM